MLFSAPGEGKAHLFLPVLTTNRPHPAGLWRFTESHGSNIEAMINAHIITGSLTDARGRVGKLTTCEQQKTVQVRRLFQLPYRMRVRKNAIPTWHDTRSRYRPTRVVCIPSSGLTAFRSTSRWFCCCEDARTARVERFMVAVDWICVYETRLTDGRWLTPNVVGMLLYGIQCTVIRFRMRLWRIFWHCFYHNSNGQWNRNSNLELSCWF